MLQCCRYYNILPGGVRGCYKEINDSSVSHVEIKSQFSVEKRKEQISVTIKECQGEYDKIPITINNPYFVKYKNIFSWQNKLVQAFLTDLSFISKIKSLEKKKKT